MSLQKIATITSSCVAFLLVTMKMIVWFLSGSIAIISSAIDSLLDFWVSVFNYFSVKNAEKPIDEYFNYWRWKMEALAAFIEWMIIISSWVFIFVESIKKIFQKSEIEYLWLSLIVMAISFVVTLGLIIFLNIVAKKTNNLVIKSDALHYKTDLYTNAWIFISIVIIHFTHFYYIDSIIWIIVSIYIIISASHIVKSWYELLLDISLPKEEVDRIIRIIKKHDVVNDYHFLKTRSSGPYNFVDVHLVFNPLILLAEAHKIADRIEEQIMQIDPDKKWIFYTHLDPYDDSETNEDRCNVFYNKVSNR